MTLQVVIGGVILGVAIAFVALGYALVFSILKFINFAHGDLITLGAYLAWTGVNVLGLGAVGSAVLSVTLTGAAAVVIERLAFRPLRNRRLSMFLSSFGVSMGCSGISVGDCQAFRSSSPDSSVSPCSPASRRSSPPWAVEPAPRLGLDPGSARAVKSD